MKSFFSLAFFGGLICISKINIKFSINANIHMKNELNILLILSLNVS